MSEVDDMQTMMGLLFDIKEKIPDNVFLEMSNLLHKVYTDSPGCNANLEQLGIISGEAAAIHTMVNWVGRKTVRQRALINLGMCFDSECIKATRLASDKKEIPPWLCTGLALLNNIVHAIINSNDVTPSEVRALANIGCKCIHCVLDTVSWRPNWFIDLNTPLAEEDSGGFQTDDEQ